jgi:endonuclease/exonuclease/phosphatase family metal-dependent hydrolase
LGNCSLTDQVRRQNQLLIASHDRRQPYQLTVPDIHRSVPPNVLAVSLENSGVTVLGFRMPAFDSKDRALKRKTWDWLIGEAGRLRDRPAVIVGDFNTAPGDSKAYCGDCLDELVASGWQHARPASGYSWRHARWKNERQIDHVFLSAPLVPKRAEYLWEFERLAPAGTSRRIGLPDHAMLVCEFDLKS